MHFPRDYEYPLYKRTPAEEMQLVPRGMFGNRQHMFVQPQKFIHNHPAEYDPKLPKQNRPECLGGGEHYFQKEYHGWEQNCSCGILTSEYRNPIEYQPVVPRNPNVRMVYANPHSSQSNICSGMSPPYAPTNTDDFPLWLKIYSRASVECDHKLHWDMFNIRDLYFFDNVLVKLYELDLEEIILWYKCYKNALSREMDKRLLKENQHRQRVLLYNNS